MRRGENRPDLHPLLHNYLYFYKVDIKCFQIPMAAFSMQLKEELRSAQGINKQRNGSRRSFIPPSFMHLWNPSFAHGCHRCPLWSVMRKRPPAIGNSGQKCSKLISAGYSACLQPKNLNSVALAQMFNIIRYAWRNLNWPPAAKPELHGFPIDLMLYVPGLYRDFRYPKETQMAPDAYV